MPTYVKGSNSMAKVLVKGNEAIAEAAIRAGCKLFFGYPITPQTEVSAYMAKKMPKIGGTFLQAESEVAAINMVYGAGATGSRVMTSSSSPGISLKSEGISYIAGADIPCVIVNIVRGGPGLGGIQPAQSDYFQAVKGGGHGDYHLLVLAPSSVQEMVDLTSHAFNKADEYRIPVMIMEPLRGGRLVNNLPEKAKKLFENYEIKRTPAEWAFRWLWNQPEVTCVLSGMNSLEMVNENVKNASTAEINEFTNNEEEFLKEVVKANAYANALTNVELIKQVLYYKKNIILKI